MSDAPALDSVIVPGGRGVRPASDLLAEFVLSRACETRRMASICTGLYPLAATGLLHGREATTHWRAARDLQRSYPDLRVDHRRRLVKDGPFYSCAGLTAGVDLALAMVEEDYGWQVALAVRRDLMLYLAEPSSSGPLPRAQQAEEGPIDRFGDLVAWIMRHLHQPLTVEAMARRAGMCPAHFTRAFKSVFGQAPGEFVENLRLNEARRRLASRGKTLRSVAASVGFRNPESFRRAFERRFGTAPRTYLNGNKSRPAAIAAPPRR